MFSMSTILMSTSKEKKLVQINMQGGQNVRIVRIFYFLTLKLYGMYGLYGFLSWKNTVFFNFHSFQFETKKEGRGGGIEREKV